MTWSFAFRSKDATFHVADSAETRFQGSLHTGQYSSFQEAHVETKDRVVEESVLKLAIARKQILSCAGSSKLASEAANIFVGCEPRKDVGAIETIEASVSPIDPQASLEILLSEFSRSPYPHVQKWLAGSDRIPSGAFDSIGSVSDTLRARALNLSQWLSNLSRLDHDMVLAMIVGAFQSLVIRGNLIQEGIGGAVIGAYADKSGSHWQSDSLYVLYNHSEFMAPLDAPIWFAPSTHTLAVLVRDRIAALFPVIVEEKVVTKVIGGIGLSSDDVKARINRYHESIRRSFQQHRLKFVVFISRTNGNVLVTPTKFKSENPLVDLNDKGIAIRPDLRLSLALPIASEDPTHVTISAAWDRGDGGIRTTVPFGTHLAFSSPN